MGRSLASLLVISGTVLLSVAGRAQSTSPLGGVWTLNRSQSELPRDIGFNVSLPTAPGAEGQAGEQSARGRGRQGAGGGGNRAPAAPFARPENYEDARRVQLLTTEARNPPMLQIIVDTPGTVTITNELGQSRTLHPTGKEESIEVQGVSIGVTSKRDGDQLVVVYHAEPGRDVRYTFARAADPAGLVIDVQFLERGAGDKARRVYGPGVGTDSVTSSGDAPTSASSQTPPGAAPPARPASSIPAKPETFDQRPGAELRGLKSLGILIEGLGPQAVACGLNRDALESSLSKRLTDGGFTVRKSSDDDTYLYVTVMTSRLANGVCMSRYDAFLYSYATAKLSHHDQPVLVQASLLHRGGMTSDQPAAHTTAVTRDLGGFVDLFITQIHDANK